MNADALSDLILLLVCAVFAWRERNARPAIAAALGLIGFAAALGVLRFSGIGMVYGPHRFFSLLAACVAFTLLACGLRWPDAPLATRSAAVGRFIVVFGGVGVALTVSGLFPLWRDIVPGLSALLIVVTALQTRAVLPILGALLLAGSFAVAATAKPDTLYLQFFNGTQALHYLLAAGLAVLLVWTAPAQARKMA